MTTRRLGIAAVMSVLFVVLVGCAGQTADSVPTSDTQQQNLLSLDEIREYGMSVSRKQTEMPPDFPVPAPVIEGEILRAEMLPGRTVAAYDIRVEHPAAETVEWYHRAYAIANWQQLEEREADAGVVVLVFVKGAARSDIAVRSEDGGGSVVEATVNVGTPVSPSY